MSSEKNLLLKDIKYSDYNLTPLNYTLVDMNGDCIPELVIEMKVGAADFVLVLHANAGNIVSYHFSNREIQEIKLDGTFMASGGAFDNGVYELKFVNDGYVINSVGHKESGHDKKGDFIISYYINNEKTTEENYKSFIENYDKKEDVVWYNFTKDKEF
ncbi:hypothetical protein PV797_09220 [Clostridiaceae bacterium M8S5]|nr:hypothetical protein PV797_09220 [Clostridiaceae bacterium M8S5]